MVTIIIIIAVGLVAASVLCYIKREAVKRFFSRLFEGRVQKGEIKTGAKLKVIRLDNRGRSVDPEGKLLHQPPPTEPTPKPAKREEKRRKAPAPRPVPTVVALQSAVKKRKAPASSRSTPPVEAEPSPEIPETEASDARLIPRIDMLDGKRFQLVTADGCFNFGRQMEGHSLVKRHIADKGQGVPEKILRDLLLVPE